MSSSHAAPVMESMRLEGPALRSDAKSAQQLSGSEWGLPESISMPEPLHERRRSINQRMSLSLRRLQVHVGSKLYLHQSPLITILCDAWKPLDCEISSREGWSAITCPIVSWCTCQEGFIQHCTSSHGACTASKVGLAGARMTILPQVQLQNNANNISLNGMAHRSRRSYSIVQQLRQSLQHHRCGAGWSQGHHRCPTSSCRAMLWPWAGARAGRASTPRARRLPKHTRLQSHPLLRAVQAPLWLHPQGKCQRPY